jgi:hypothetical protein
MSRRCAEPVEVRLGNEAPAQFLWRDRLYRVRGVHAHWVEAERWWRSAAARAVLTGADVGAAVGPTGADAGERELWRVEAGRGQAAGTGVFDLCFDAGAATWTVARVLD